MTLVVGDGAPDFSLPGTGGSTYSLSQYRGTPVVLVFYPADNSPVCTTQLNTYSKQIEDFDQVGAQVLALSPQDISTHESFAKKHVFGFRCYPTLTRKSVGCTESSARSASIDVQSWS